MNNNEFIYFEDFVQLNKSRFKVSVNILRDDNGKIHFCAVVDDVKRIEVDINENGIWYDTNGGTTKISEAIGNLIEQKTL